MTDLDRQIAEIKGWRPVTPADLEKMASLKAWFPQDHVIGCKDRDDGGLDFGTYKDSDPTWSTSDSKALELVDEYPEAGFSLHRFGSTSGEYRPWAARFTFRRPGQPDWNIQGEAPTRPEAICRAYLAAMTWMKERGK